MDKMSLINLAIDTSKGKVMNYSQQESNDVLRKAFIDILGTDKVTYKTFRRHPELYEIIEVVLDQTIVNGWGEDPFFNAFVEVKDVEAGNRNEFYVPDNSLLMVSDFSGNHWDVRGQRIDNGTSFSVKTKWFVVKIVDEFARFISGRIDWNNFVNRVGKSMDAKVQSEIYASFMGASKYLPAQFSEAGKLTETRMLEICEHVSASSNAPITIIGTKVALSKLGVEDRYLSDSMKDDINRRGYMPTWKGYDVMPIKQVHKVNTFDFMIDDKKLLIVPSGTKPIKVVNEGETMMKEVTDPTKNQDMSLEFTFMKRFGVGVVFNTLYGSYEITQ